MSDKEMPFAYQTKEGQKFLDEDCTLMKDGKLYFNNITGKIIQTFITGRSVHYEPGLGGGDVVRVHHLYSDKPPIINYGQPILITELLGYILMK